MRTIINARELRAHLAEVVEKVRKGGRLTVLYRSRPAFDIVPVLDSRLDPRDVENDSLFRAEPVGSSRSGDAARRHDEVLYS